MALLVHIRRTRLARFAKGPILAMLSQAVAAVCVIAYIFMPLSGGIGVQTLVLTGSTNIYQRSAVTPVMSIGYGY